MALAKQFYSSFKSYNGWDYYLEIWVESYGGSATEISIGASGPIITYGTDEQDRFSPILSSKLELPFMVTNTTEDTFIKNIRENFNEQDVYIHLYRASSSDYSSVAPLWSGFVLMDLSASPDLYYPYPVTLTAVDGLSLLKEIDFVQSGTAGSYTDSDMYSNNGRFTYWIKEILLKSGASTTAEGSTQDYKFTTAINWFNSVMPTITQSTDPFYQTKCNTQMFFSKDANDNFTVVNCYDVLKNLLKHWGARIIYWKHIYYIVQIQEYNTAESGTYANPDNIDTRTYTKTGAFDSSSDNLGDSYWTRYNLLIDDVEGGIQKLTGTQFNYLPQLKRTQANFIDYGNKNYFGGLPFDLTTGQNDVIKQATLVDVSTDGTMILIIPLDVTMVTQYQGVLNMLLYFRLYITDGVTTYYLRYDPSNTPKYYWEDDSNINLNTKRTFWRSQLDNIVGTQTKVGFHQQIDFVDVNGTSLTLNGEWDVFTDIDNWGSNNANNGSFEFLYGYGLLTTNAIYTPSATTIYWTNTLNPAYQSPLNLSIIGTTSQPSAYNPSNSLNPTTQNNIVTYTTSLNQNPFEGKLLIVNTSSSGALYGSFVSVSPSPTTKDSQIVDFGELIWGDTLLASSEGSLKVWNGSSFVKSNVIGTWGLGSTSGTNSFTEMLLSEYLYGQTKVIESPSMRLVIGETNKNQNDGSGSRPNYVNPIGRLKGYSATGTTPYYIFKSGSFHLLKDEIDYQGYQIIRDPQTLTKTDDVIIGPDILQDKTNIIGQKTPQTNSLINKVTQNSFITTTSALKSAYGNDIAVNGIFASDTGWTKGTGWSIASNKASFSPTGSASDIKQDTLTNALTYKIVVSLTLSAGALSVKAGSSGNATVLSSSGTYEIFSTCAGSTEVIFEASAAFEGYIEKVVVQQQVPVTSISINAIGEAVFKTNDVLNIADVDGSDVNQFTVSADQGASDTSISVTSKLISEDILEGSIILVNQNDLAAQYQNKTKGTVGGFDITATSIDSGSVSIQSYIDDDSFATASATSLATSESIKAYVDTQVGTADTLQEVTDLGNTTTNSITIGSSSSPSYALDVYGDAQFRDTSENVRLYLTSNNAYNSIIYFGDENNGTIGRIQYKNSDNSLGFYTNASEKMRLTSDGYLGIGTTSPDSDIEIETTNAHAQINIDSGRDANLILDKGASTRRASIIYKTSGTNNWFVGSADSDVVGSGDDYYIGTTVGGTNAEFFIKQSNGNVGINQINPTEKLHVVGDSLVTGDSHADAFKPAVSGNPIKFKNFDSTTEFARITDGGQLLIATTTSATNEYLSIGTTSVYNTTAHIYSNAFGSSTLRLTRGSNVWDINNNGIFNVSFGGVDRFSINTNGQATFASQVTIPATPVASTDAASKGYVDAQVSATDSLQEVTTVGNTTTNSIMIGSSSTPQGELHIVGQSGSQARIYVSDVDVGVGATDSLLITKSGSTSYIYNRDSNSSLYLGANDVSNVLVITNNSNVLIGTTTDSGFKLNVSGSITTAGGSANITAPRHIVADSNAMIYRNNDNLTLLTYQSKNITFMPNNSESVRFLANGNVLISTTTDDGSSKLQVDGDVKLNDNFLYIGTGNDLRINHNGTDSFITNHTGDLKIINYSDDKDIIFQCDDGSGGTTAYITLDGSAGYTTVQKHMVFADSASLYLGTGADLQLAHDGSNSTIQNNVGTLTIRQDADDGDIVFKCDNGSGGTTDYIRLDGSQTTVNVSQNLLINTTTDVGVPLYVNGVIRAVGGGIQAAQDYGFTLNDESGSNRYGLKFGAAGVTGGSNLLMLTNRSFNSATGGGEVAIGGNTNTSGVTEVEIARFIPRVTATSGTQKKVSLDAVLELTEQTAPANPASGESIIWMDSESGDLKVKINYGGTTVTRILAAYEG